MDPPRAPPSPHPTMAEMMAATERATQAALSAQSQLAELRPGLAETEAKLAASMNAQADGPPPMHHGDVAPQLGRDALRHGQGSLAPAQHGVVELHTLFTCMANAAGPANVAGLMDLATRFLPRR